QILAIDPVNQQITLDSPLTLDYVNGSVLTNTYTDPQGTQPINAAHRDGINDRLFQYRVLLTTSDRTQTPYLLEERLGYFPASGVYQPDGVIDGNGDCVVARSPDCWSNGYYGTAGSGAGGNSSHNADPGFNLGQALVPLQIQNDGTTAGGADTYTVSMNPDYVSDASGVWSIFLNDGQDHPLPVSFDLDPGTFRDYTLKVVPSSHAPAYSTQSVILDIHSENEYAKVDSIQADVTVNPVYQADGIIDEHGDGPFYDPEPNPIGHDRSGQGQGGTASQSAAPGDTVRFSVKIENEGNIQDRYTLSQTSTCHDSNDPTRALPFPGTWKILINDGTTDYDMTSGLSVVLPQSSTQYIAATVKADAISSVQYSLKVLPTGEPITCDTILKIDSVGTGATLDSVKATTVLAPTYGVDLWIEGNGDTLPGTPKGSLGSGGGGEYSKGIYGGATGTFDIRVQNEGNIADYYELSWNTPGGWITSLLNQDGSTLCAASPCLVPASDSDCPYKSVSQCLAIPGEVTPLRLQVTPGSSFTTGDQSIIVDGKSKGDPDKVDSVMAKVWANALNITLSSVTSTTVGLSWTSPAWEKEGYDLRYSTQEITEANFSSAPSVRLGSTATSAPVTQLYANKPYYFAVKTLKGGVPNSVISTCNDTSPPSFDAGFPCRVTTPASDDTTLPAAVTDLHVRVDPDSGNTIATADSVTLCWTAPADGSNEATTPVTGYLLKYSTRKIVDDGAPPGMGEIRFGDADAALEFSKAPPQGGSCDLTQKTPQECLGIPKSPGSEECYRIKVQNILAGDDGIRGTPDDINRTPNTQFFFALKSQDERGVQGESAMSNVPLGLTAMSSNTYNMVSVPKVPNPNTPAGVFGDDVNPSNPSSLYLYWWDSREVGHEWGCYDGLPGPHDPNEIKNADGTPACVSISIINEEVATGEKRSGIGKGYFLWSPRLDIVLDAPSGSTDTCTTPSPTCGTDVNNQTFYAFPLQEGWNMVGNPFGKEVHLSDIQVQSPAGDTLFFYEATEWVEGAIYTYNGVNYTAEVCNQSGMNNSVNCDAVLQPWKGYWIQMKAGENYNLLIPKP
ncbi:MAG: fibronectin type III domain-containing protein, partial [Nitrospirae bacterium]|nr:fibronectin type III domain-containing protein [Nitrospirota bacterium]